MHDLLRERTAMTSASAADGSALPGAVQADRLRFITAGSVDDGKSTLIGRLLYDTKSLFDDQVEALEANFDLARLTDGLRAEREQGITIDVAWRYFATPARRFVVADCPGHAQYTRNMVTGASNAEVAVLLVDARHGVVEQTRRHAFICAHMGLARVIFCVNKLDLFDFSEDVFRRIETDLRALGHTLGVPAVDVMPISALTGANVVDAEPKLAWFDGPTLLGLLETVPDGRAFRDAGHDGRAFRDAGRDGRASRDAEPQGHEASPARFPVQIVLRAADEARAEDRRYGGTVAGGVLRVGDAVTVQPGGQHSTVAAIETFDGPRTEATVGDAVTVRLAHALDVGRGSILLAAESAPAPVGEATVLVCWMSERPLNAAARLLVRQGPRTVRTLAEALIDRVDLDHLTHVPGPEALAQNDLGRVRLRFTEPLALDTFAACPANGRLVLIDPRTNETVGAALVLNAGVAPADADDEEGW